MTEVHKLTKNERLVLRALGDRGGVLSAIRLRAATHFPVAEFVTTIHQISDRKLIQIAGNRILLTARGTAALSLPSKRNAVGSVLNGKESSYLAGVRTARLPPDAFYTPNMELALRGLKKLGYN